MGVALSFVIRVGDEAAERDYHRSICGVLHDKGVLSSEHYQYEVDVVAPDYDDCTYQGYVLIVWPIVKIIESVSALDTLVHQVVMFWIRLQKRKNEKQGFLNGMMNVCTGISRYVGVFLFFVRRAF